MSRGPDGSCAGTRRPVGSSQVSAVCASFGSKLRAGNVPGLRGVHRQPRCRRTPTVDRPATMPTRGGSDREVGSNPGPLIAAQSVPVRAMGITSGDVSGYRQAFRTASGRDRRLRTTSRWAAGWREEIRTFGRLIQRDARACWVLRAWPKAGLCQPRRPISPTSTRSSVTPGSCRVDGLGVGSVFRPFHQSRRRSMVAGLQSGAGIVP